MGLLTFPLICLAVLSVAVGGENVEECKYTTENSMVKYDLTDVKCNIFQTLNYRARPYLEYYLKAPTTLSIDKSTSYIVNTAYGPCYTVSVQPFQITVYSHADNSSKTIQDSNIQIRQWDGNGLYVNGERVGSVCPLTVSHGGEDRMDLAFMYVTSVKSPGQISFTFPHRPSSIKKIDENRTPRILTGSDNGIDKPSKAFNCYTVIAMFFALLIGSSVGLFSVSCFIRCVWWKDLKGQNKKSKKGKSSKASKSKTNKSKKSKRSKKEKPRPDTPMDEKTVKETSTSTNLQSAKGTPSSATSPNKQYENL